MLNLALQEYSGGIECNTYTPVYVDHSDSSKLQLIRQIYKRVQTVRPLLIS
jgi:hypothetical protein